MQIYAYKRPICGIEGADLDVLQEVMTDAMSCVYSELNTDITLCGDEDFERMSNMGIGDYDDDYRTVRELFWMDIDPKGLFETARHIGRVESAHYWNNDQFFRWKQLSDAVRALDTAELRELTSYLIDKLDWDRVSG